MLLRDSLYYINAQSDATYTIHFNASHPVFAGHFPEYPIVPGACLVQIAQELMTDYLNKPVTFTAIRNLKFRQPVTPDKQVQFIIAGNTITIVDEQSNYASFAATYLCPDTDL